MHTLILNLTRFGDLLQTQPVVAGYAARGDAVSMVCLENFAQAADLLPGTMQVAPFPGAGLLADLDKDWPHALQRLYNWRQQLFDAVSGATSVVNMTPTQSARLLSRFLTLRNAQIVGFGLDEHGFGFYGNSWAAFLQMSSAHRGSSPFNLVDLMLRAANLSLPGKPLSLSKPSARLLSEADALLRARAPAGCAGFAAFQLGASEPHRQWPEAYFARLGDQCWKKLHLCPVLLGAKSDRSLASAYMGVARAPCIDLIGQTSLDQLAAVLCQVRGLVTNDTGTMHLAAGLGRPILALFLATAQPWDTGPYQPGSLCLEPDLECHPCAFGTSCPHDHACRRRISPDLAFALTVRLFAAESPQGHAREDVANSGARVWRSAWDGHGFMDLLPLSKHGDDLRTQWIRIQRHYYRQFLEQAATFHPVESAGLLPDGVRTHLRSSLEQSMALLQLLEGQAQVLARAPLPKVKQKFLAYWERLQAHWQNDPYFTVLGRLWAVESQEAGLDLHGIATLTGRYARLIRSWQGMFAE